jgi:carbon monoxide dehydrogenase subunit G
MDMTGERRIAASRQTVWAALNDANVLKQCIPGCESLEKLFDTKMTAKVTVGIGPVHASFTGRVKLSDLDPPMVRLSGEGSGGLAGHAKGGATVRLFDDGKGTLMKYEAQADVGGKLAQLGSRLIDSAAKKLTDEFFEKFAAVVGPMPKEVGTAASVSRSAPAATRASANKGWWAIAAVVVVVVVLLYSLWH